MLSSELRKLWARELSVNPSAYVPTFSFSHSPHHMNMWLHRHQCWHKRASGMERWGARAQVRPGPWEQALWVSLQSPESQPQGQISEPTGTL